MNTPRVVKIISRAGIHEKHGGCDVQEKRFSASMGCDTKFGADSAEGCGRDSHPDNVAKANRGWRFRHG